MITKKKLLLALPVALLVMGGGYKMVLAKDAPKPEPRIHGDVYVLGKDFLVNLDDGHFAKLGVAIVVDHGSAAPAASGGHGSAAPKPPEGYGPLPQEAAVRDIVTDTLTDVAGDDLTDSEGREALKERIERRVKKQTDVKIHDVLFTDVSVQ
jgi:flagellar basal body-associated protein FliL